MSDYVWRYKGELHNCSLDQIVWLQSRKHKQPSIWFYNVYNSWLFYLYSFFFYISLSCNRQSNCPSQLLPSPPFFPKFLALVLYPVILMKPVRTIEPIEINIVNLKREWRFSNNIPVCSYFFFLLFCLCVLLYSHKLLHCAVLKFQYTIFFKSRCFHISFNGETRSFLLVLSNRKLNYGIPNDAETSKLEMKIELNILNK